MRESRVTNKKANDPDFTLSRSHPNPGAAPRGNRKPVPGSSCVVSFLKTSSRAYITLGNESFFFFSFHLPSELTCIFFNEIRKLVVFNCRELRVQILGWTMDSSNPLNSSLEFLQKALKASPINLPNKSPGVSGGEGKKEVNYSHPPSACDFSDKTRPQGIINPRRVYCRWLITHGYAGQYGGLDPKSNANREIFFHSYHFDAEIFLLISRYFYRKQDWTHGVFASFWGISLKFDWCHLSRRKIRESSQFIVITFWSKSLSFELSIDYFTKSDV